MPSWAITLLEIDGYPVLRIIGYLSKEAGLELASRVATLLAAGQNRLIFDFTGCSNLSSPGVALLLGLVIRIDEAAGGVSVCIGLDRSKTEFLQILGVLPIARAAGDLNAATALLATNRSG